MKKYAHSPCGEKKYSLNKDGKPSRWYWKHVETCEDFWCKKTKNQKVILAWYKRLLNKLKGGLK